MSTPRAPRRGLRQARAPQGSTILAEAERFPRPSWREPSSERKEARLPSPRKRRLHARWLRWTANRAVDAHPVSRRGGWLSCDRVARVRGELLEIAALLKRAADPDPTCVAELLSDGHESPLHNREVRLSALWATWTTSSPRSRRRPRGQTSGATPRRPRPKGRSARAPTATTNSALAAGHSSAAADPATDPRPYL